MKILTGADESNRAETVGSPQSPSCAAVGLSCHVAGPVGVGVGRGVCVEVGTIEEGVAVGVGPAVGVSVAVGVVVVMKFGAQALALAICLF